MAPSPFTTFNGTTNGRSEFPQHLQRHHPYYINGGDIHFLVENYVFRVHRYFFERESAYFRDKLSSPATPGRAQQGTEDANAIVLDVRAQDFEKLMWVFYNPKYSIYEANVDTWATILQLSHRWWFPEVKSLCVRELEQKEMTSIDRIVLYQKYEVDENLLVSRFAAVCAREEPISVEEGQMLGIKTAMRLTQARERLRSSDGSKSPLPPHRNDRDVLNIVISLFEIVTPDSLQTPITATATEAAVLPQPQQPQAQQTSATTPSTTEAAQTAASTAPMTTTPGATTTTTTSAPNGTTTATEPIKGPTPKSSLMSMKGNTKPEHKTTPSMSGPTPDAKLATEPAKTNGSPDPSQASVKETPASRNASTTDLANNVTSPHTKSPGVGSTFSGLWGSRNKEGDGVDATGETAGTDADTDTNAGGRGAKKNRKKTLF